jgi:hypothetical protein
MPYKKKTQTTVQIGGSKESTEAKKEEFIKKVNTVELAPVIDNDTGSPEEKQKRHRRTKAEIEAERGKPAQESVFDETGYEMISGIFKWRADEDTKKFGLAPCMQEYFDPLSKNIMKISNYYLGKYARPIHFLLGMTAFEAFIMLQARSVAIREATKNTIQPSTVDKNQPQTQANTNKKPTVVSLVGHAGEQVHDQTKKD